MLTESNHGRLAGTVVATVEMEDRTCTLTWRLKEGMLQSERLEIDHLGAKYYDPGSFGDQPMYVILVDNWKLYPAMFSDWIKYPFR